jgi:hypothetical protein
MLDSGAALRVDKAVTDKLAPLLEARTRTGETPLHRAVTKVRGATAAASTAHRFTVTHSRWLPRTI